MSDLNAKLIQKFTEKAQSAANKAEKSLYSEFRDYHLGLAKTNPYETYGIQELAKSESLCKPVPKGVDPGKYDSCVEQVKDKGDAKNAYAICATALKRSEEIEKQDSPMDQMAYKECVSRQKRLGSANPYAQCKWEIGRASGASGASGAPSAPTKSETAKTEPKSDVAKAELKTSNLPEWGNWGMPDESPINVLDQVDREEIDRKKEDIGDKKEEAVYGGFVKSFQGPWENSKKLIRKQPNPKPPLRPNAMRKPGGESMVKPPKTPGAPTAHFKEPLTMKSLESGVSFNSLKKEEAQAIPTHARKAKERLDSGDHSGAIEHAKQAITLASKIGHVGTRAHQQAVGVMRLIPASKGGWGK